MEQRERSEERSSDIASASLLADEKRPAAAGKPLLCKTTGEIVSSSSGGEGTAIRSRSYDHHRRKDHAIVDNDHDKLENCSEICGIERVGGGKGEEAPAEVLTNASLPAWGGKGESNGKDGILRIVSGIDEGIWDGGGRGGRHFRLEAAAAQRKLLTSAG